MKLLPSTLKHTRIQALHSYGWRFTKDYGHRNKKQMWKRMRGVCLGRFNTDQHRATSPRLTNVTNAVNMV